jgi:hypothetical protein
VDLLLGEEGGRRDTLFVEDDVEFDGSIEPAHFGVFFGEGVFGGGMEVDGIDAGSEGEEKIADVGGAVAGGGELGDIEGIFGIGVSTGDLNFEGEMMEAGFVLELIDQLGNFGHVAGGEEWFPDFGFFEEDALIDELLGEVGDEGGGGWGGGSGIDEAGEGAREIRDEDGGAQAGGLDPGSWGGTGGVEGISFESEGDALRGLKHPGGAGEDELGMRGGGGDETEAGVRGRGDIGLFEDGFEGRRKGITQAGDGQGKGPGAGLNDLESGGDCEGVVDAIPLLVVVDCRDTQEERDGGEGGESDLKPRERGGLMMLAAEVLQALEVAEMNFLDSFRGRGKPWFGGEIVFDGSVSEAELFAYLTGGDALDCGDESGAGSAGEKQVVSGGIVRRGEGLQAGGDGG